MDFIIGFFSSALPYLLLSVAGVFLLKLYLVANIKRFDIAETIFSFFRLYNYDERSMSSSKRRITFMRWNNFLNYYVYAVLGIAALIYLVTRNV